MFFLHFPCFVVGQPFDVWALILSQNNKHDTTTLTQLYLRHGLNLVYTIIYLSCCHQQQGHRSSKAPNRFTVSTARKNAHHAQIFQDGHLYISFSLTSSIIFLYVPFIYKTKRHQMTTVCCSPWPCANELGRRGYLGVLEPWQMDCETKYVQSTHQKNTMMSLMCVLSIVL